MSNQPSADERLRALIASNEGDLIECLVCMTKCSRQAAEIFVTTMGIHIDALIQRERERQQRAER